MAFPADIQKLLEIYLPAWSERIGYRDLTFHRTQYTSTQQITDEPALREIKEILPEGGLFPIPLSLAPPNSLHGIVTNLENSPASMSELTTMLDILAPGGLAYFHLDKKVWSRKDLAALGRGVGYQIRMLDTLKKGHFLILQKEILHRPPSMDDLTLSLVIPVSLSKRHISANELNPEKSQRTEKISDEVNSGEAEDTQSREQKITRLKTSVQAWLDFLKEKGMFTTTEILIIYDRDIEPFDIYAPNLITIPHYRKTGKACCLHTGISFASGRNILLDETEGRIPPSALFVLLNEAIRKERKGKHAVFSGYVPDTIAERNQNEAVNQDPTSPVIKNKGIKKTLQNFLTPKLTGINRPWSEFRLMPVATARLLAAAMEKAEYNDPYQAMARLSAQNTVFYSLPVRGKTADPPISAGWQRLILKKKLQLLLK